MRILLVVHHELSEAAGAPGSTLQLAREFRRLGHHTDLFSLDDLPRRLSEPAAMAVFPLFVLRHLHRSAPYDVVDAAAGDAWLASFRRTGGRLPLLVARSHGLEHGAHRITVERARRSRSPLSWKYRLYRGGVHLSEVATALRRADLALLMNKPDLELAVGRLGVRSERARLVRNGISADLLGRPLEVTPMAGDEPVGIAFVGSYIWRKGTEQAAAALGAVLRRHRRIRVGFFGVGCDTDEVLADYDPGSAGRIEVVERYSPGDLPGLLRGYHVLVFPTLGEGFSLALVEAMACGLAPVTTDAPGPAEIVRSGTDGLIVAAGDAAALEAALEAVISDRVRLDALRRAAHARAQDYSWAAVAEETIALYQTHLRRRLDARPGPT